MRYLVYVTNNIYLLWTNLHQFGNVDVDGVQVADEGVEQERIGRTFQVIFVNLEREEMVPIVGKFFRAR